MKYVKKNIADIHPYENNPRNNKKSIEKVAQSIREFGFLQPIVCDKDDVILAGHTRYEAAKLLGLKTVPVIYANDLTSGQAKAYRLADNKVGEGSEWLPDLLTRELEAIALEAPEIETADFGFTGSDDIRKQKSWGQSAKKCGMKKDIHLREKCGFLYTSFFSTGKEGTPIDRIKEDPEMVRPFADNLADYVADTLGGNLKAGDWCLATTPRRRHSEGFHFATEICRAAAPEIGIPFREDIVIAHGRGRVAPEFELKEDPPECNVVLYDDIMTTGMTMKETRDLLIKKGHTVLSIVAIRNQ